MFQKLLIVLIALSLLGCATLSGSGDSPASDLDALVSSVERNLQPRLLENGKEYCGEDSVTEDEQDSCIGDLEDAVFASNRDKERGLKVLKDGVARIKLALNPCGAVARFFRLSKCEVAK